MGLIYSNIPELEGTDTDVALSNLRDLEKELGDIFEKRIAHLCELANAILKDGGDRDVVKSIILSVRSDGEIYPITAISDNEKEIRALLAGVSIVERIILFKQVFSEKGFGDAQFSVASAQHTSAPGRIAYVKNSYNDTAFAYFSSLFDGARASYYDTVADVCESVSSGSSEYCILPLETAKDGRLLGFYNAVIEHGLKINAEYDVASSSGDTYTRYALLSADLTSAIHVKRIKNLPRFFEMTYTDTENLPIKDIISAAECCGLEVSSMDTVYSSERNNRAINIVFSANGADVKTFSSFLSVDCPDHTVIGYYQRG